MAKEIKKAVKKAVKKIVKKVEKQDLASGNALAIAELSKRIDRVVDAISKSRKVKGL